MGPTTERQQVRARTVAKGCAEEVNDNDDICASTPIFYPMPTTNTATHLQLDRQNRRHLNSLPTCQSSQRRLAHVSTNRVLQPGGQHSVEAQQRSRPKAWQNLLAETLQQLGMQRLTNEPNVLTEQKATRSSSCYLISYPWENQQLPTSSLQTYCSSYGLTVGNSVNFLGRNISNQGNYYEISLASTYTAELLKEADMRICNASPA